MAEFKLGRIRFVWKNDWAASTVYYQDDVVAYGGKIYICVIGHTSNADNFFVDFNISPAKWNIVSEGQTWKGDWQPQEIYNPDDIVRYGGRLYIATTYHTSAADSTIGLEADLVYWQVFAEGIEWKGDWATSFDYKANDLVKYGATTYICITNHISAATDALGLEADQAKWQIFNRGFDYKGDWATSSRYKVNDVIRFGANLWIATAYHTSTTFASDAGNWEKFVDGFQYENRWGGLSSYQPGDVVSYGGNQYVAKTSNTGKIPPAYLDDWDLFSEGLRFQGAWGEDSTNFEYEVGDLVTLGGYAYRCILGHSGQKPPNATYWSEFSRGVDWRGEWLDDQEYYKGDVVRYGDNSYVCVQNHISEGDDYSTETPTDPGGGAQNSRPDQDTSGTYWNLIAIGSETSVLTTKGDLVYYSDGGPTRLPIGDDGQILQVSADGLPEWVTLSSADDVYFVAENGVDAPAPGYGKSLDRPFRSIRYAAQQVELGTKAPKARRLLELNRRFIQREITEWTDYQITYNTTTVPDPLSIWYEFSYDSYKCERDMGLLIDAFIWDLGHGGNVKSREAALAYVNDTVGSAYLGQKEQTKASIAYGLTLIEKVLKQQAPAVNYQSTNGDNSTAIVEQYFETALGDQAVVEYESTVTASYGGTSISNGGGSGGGGGGGGY